MKKTLLIVLYLLTSFNRVFTQETKPAIKILESIKTTLQTLPVQKQELSNKLTEINNYASSLKRTFPHIYKTIIAAISTINATDLNIQTEQAIRAKTTIKKAIVKLTKIEKLQQLNDKLNDFQKLDFMRPQQSLIPLLQKIKELISQLKKETSNPYNLYNSLLTELDLIAAMPYNQRKKDLAASITSLEQELKLFTIFNKNLEPFEKKLTSIVSQKSIEYNQDLIALLKTIRKAMSDQTPKENRLKSGFLTTIDSTIQSLNDLEKTTSITKNTAQEVKLHPA